ncbi:MAG: hypothetical protein KJZ68_10765, partial [Phycisphaerales bacterium]|nr:hypothetical protein [Phycisphaerales bacterium]
SSPSDSHRAWYRKWGQVRFTKGELERLQRFLLDRHVPRSAAEEITEARGASAGHAPPPAAGSAGRAITGTAAPRPVAPVVPETSSAEPSVPESRYLCSKCHSLHVRVRHGRYGYYFKCRDCDGNTWIDTRIEETGRKGRIRKSGRDFFLVCPDTGKERLVFTNPDDGE